MVNLFLFFFKQKTAYERRISDWSSDVCSSDLRADTTANASLLGLRALARLDRIEFHVLWILSKPSYATSSMRSMYETLLTMPMFSGVAATMRDWCIRLRPRPRTQRSEEHTSELKSLMRISYAVFCLKQKTK